MAVFMQRDQKLQRQEINVQSFPTLIFGMQFHNTAAEATAKFQSNITGLTLICVWEFVKSYGKRFVLDIEPSS